MEVMREEGIASKKLFVILLPPASLRRGVVPSVVTCAVPRSYTGALCGTWCVSPFRVIS